MRNRDKRMEYGQMKRLIGGKFVGQEGGRKMG